MKHKVSIAILVAIVCMSMTIGALPADRARASSYTVHWTIWPSGAWFGGVGVDEASNACTLTFGEGGSVGQEYGGDARLDSLYAPAGTCQYVAIGGFTSDYTYPYFWPNQTFPPDEATILWVEAYGFFKVLSGCRNVTFAYALNATYPYEYYGFDWWINNTQQPWPIYAYSEYQVRAWNMTNLRNWTPYDVKNALQASHTAIRIWSPDLLSNGQSLYVDYVGIRYAWTNDTIYTPPETIEPGEWHVSFSGSTIFAILGGIGFIGMIAYPALAIANRKRGAPIDSRVMGIASAISTEALFIALFVAAVVIYAG